MGLIKWFDSVSYFSKLDVTTEMSHNQVALSEYGKYQWLLYQQDARGNVTGLICNNMINKYAFQAVNTGESKKHSHDFIEIGFVISGEVCQVFENEVAVFPQGSLFMIGRGVQHYELPSTTDSAYFFLLFPPTIFDDLLLHDPPSQAVYEFMQKCLLENQKQYCSLLFCPKDNAAAEEYLLRISEEIYNYADGFDYFIKGYLIRLFRELATHYELQLHKSDKSEFRELIYQKVCQYMKDNCANVNLQSMSRVFNYNTAYFNRLIQKYSGKSYIQQLQAIRLEKSAELLIATDLSVETIAMSVGYKNLSYFYELFHKQYQMTPAAYRMVYSR